MAKVVEMRTYGLKPGSQAEWLKTYQETVMELQKEVLGQMVGYFTTEIGPLNQVIHLWAYDGLDERARRRADLVSRPEWQAFLPKVRPLIETQESKILIPAPFSPMP